MLRPNRGEGLVVSVRELAVVVKLFSSKRGEKAYVENLPPDRADWLLVIEMLPPKRGERAWP